VDRLVVASRILVPGVLDVLGDLRGIETLDLREVALADDPGRQI
jgi:hypothetical protein